MTKEKMVKYGKVVNPLSEKWHKWNIKLFFHQGIVQQAKERDNRIATNPWLIVYA